jgi:hypothetical protein
MAPDGTTDLPTIELVTRELLGGGEMVVGMRYNGTELVLPYEGEIRVDYEAGAGTGTVHVALMAGKIRYVPEKTGQ